MLLLLALACTPPPPSGETGADETGAVDSAVDGWRDPIRRLGDVVVDTEGMELTDAVLAGDRLALLGQHQDGAGGVWLFELSDPDAPGFLGRTTLSHVQSGCWDGARLWGVDRQDSLMAFDVSGATPTLEATYPIFGADGDVDCDPDWVAWGRGRVGGWAARQSDGALGEPWPLQEEVVGVRVDGEVLWTASTGWLRAWRLDPTQGPVALSALALDGACRDIAVEGELLAVACGAEGVHLVSRDPDEPALLGTWRGAQSARAVGLSGDTLLIAGWTDLLAIDASDPRQPAFIGAEAAGASVMGLAPGADGRVYVADWSRPFTAQVVGGQAPELRLSPSVPAPGEVVGVYNDGTAPLTLSGVSAGSLSGEVVEPGRAVSWTLPTDLEAGAEVSINSDDPDEPEAALRVASLGGLTVGATGPDFREWGLDGRRYDNDALRGEVVFLGLFTDG